MTIVFLGFISEALLNYREWFDAALFARTEELTSLVQHGADTLNAVSDGQSAAQPVIHVRWDTNLSHTLSAK